MPTFIDESGDTGWKPGAKGYFRLAAVWVPDEDEEACRASLRAVRAACGLRAGFEFKFARTEGVPAVRRAFFEAALGHPFVFAVSAFDKGRMTSGSHSAAEFYRCCAVDLAATLRPTYRAAEHASGRPLRGGVVVDDNQNAEFLSIVREKFGGLASGVDVGRKLLGKVTFRDSTHDELVQLADMLVGAAGASLDGSPAWYEMVSERCVDFDMAP